MRTARARIRREIRRWQKQCDAEDPNEGAGNEVSREALARWEQQGEEIPARLERLQKSGLKKISRTDPDSRFLRQRDGFTLGYTGTLAVSEDHLIVGQCVTQETNDNGLLLPMLDQVEQRCGSKVQRVSADSGFFSVENLQTLEERQIDGYVRTRSEARPTANPEEIPPSISATQPLEKTCSVRTTRETTTKQIFRFSLS